MGQPVSQSVVQAFFQAYARRDPAAIQEFLDDDVEWSFTGPVEIFPFCGHRRGKQAAMELFARMPVLFSVRRMEPDEMVIDGDCAATFAKLTAAEKDTGRILTFHCAYFVMFRDDKVVSMRAVADTFGLIEQLNGVEIRMGEPASADAPDCGLVAV